MSKDSFASLLQGSPIGQDRAKRRLKAGETLEAPVLQVSGEYIYVDVGTPSDGRIPRIELLDESGQVRVSVGDRIRVSVVDPRSDGPTLKALATPTGPSSAGGPLPDEVLKAKVRRVEKFGIFVSTPKGDGLVPLRELPLPPGSDHRRLFPVGRDLDVVLLDVSAPGRMRFSALRVAEVEEKKNFRDFAQKPAESESGSGLGSLGDVLRQKLPGSNAQSPGTAPATTGRKNRG